MNAMKKLKRVIIMAAICGIILLCGFIISSSYVNKTYAASELERYGIVSAIGGAWMRSGAGTSYSQVLLLYPLQCVDIVDDVRGSDGYTWYKIEKGGYEGYVRSDLVEASTIPEYVYDKEFEDKLSAENFPEDYKEKLRKIHMIYPNWEFVSGETNLDWQTVVEKEEGYLFPNFHYKEEADP